MPKFSELDRDKTVLVRVAGVAMSFGGRSVLGPVDLELRAREKVAIVGPNGAGKTTLLRALAGVITPTRGELDWRQQAYSQISRLELARRVAYVPQVRPTHVPLTVRQVVLLGRHPHLPRFQLGWREADFSVANRALEATGLAELADRPLAELSGGERQSVYIAAALAQEADLLVLDEPTTHLDPAHQRQVASLIATLGRGARTVVTATHDLNFAALIADRVIGLRAGAIVADGSPSEVLTPQVLAELYSAPFEVVPTPSGPRILLEISEG